MSAADAGIETAADGGRPPDLVQVGGVGKYFERAGRRVAALTDVNLAVSRGEFVCLIGPSGCGKSTLLNILAGILPYEQGTVLVDGRPVTGPGAERGMMFQSPMLFPWLTTRQNVMFGPKAQHRGDRRASAGRVDRDAVDTILRTVGLTGFEDAFPKELSGGMRHRAAFARAIINRPKLLLMDEPFGALDALTRTRMQEFLLDMWQRFQITVVFVTHDIEEAILLGDRVCVMNSRPGSISEEVRIELGRPRGLDVLETPQFLALKRHLRESLTAAHPAPREPEQEREPESDAGLIVARHALGGE